MLKFECYSPIPWSDEEIMGDFVCKLGFQYSTPFVSGQKVFLRAWLSISLLHGENRDGA